MHLLAVIPFAAVLIAAAFAAISIAWCSDRRDTSAMSGIFAVAGIWAFLDLLVQLENDPHGAIFWLRLVHMPALFLGPFAILLLGQVLPQCEAGLLSPGGSA